MLANHSLTPSPALSPCLSSYSHDAPRSFFQTLTLTSKHLQEYQNMLASQPGTLSPKAGSLSPTLSNTRPETAKQQQQNNSGERPTRPTAPNFSFMRRTRSGEQSQEQPREQPGEQSPIMYEEVATPTEPEKIKPPRIPSFHMLSRSETPLFDVNTISADNLSRVLLRDHPSNRSPAFSSSSSNYDSPVLNQKPYHEMDLPSGQVHASPSTESNGFASPTASPRPDGVTNGGSFGYSSPNLANPHTGRRLRRKKDPLAFNILVAGTKNSGKSSFIDFMLSSLAKPIKQRANTPSPKTATKSATQYGAFTPHYLETEIDGERIGITMYDSKGLERSIVDLQLREMTSFVESKFQETFSEEQKVLRSTTSRDTHIHCVILLLDPSRLDANTATSSSSSNGSRSTGMNGKSRIIGSLDEDLDIDVLRLLNAKTTVIPIISKADTITTAHMDFLKRSVSDGIKKLGFDPYEGLNLESDGESDDESVGHSTIRESIIPHQATEIDDQDSGIVDHTQIIKTVDDKPKSTTETSDTKDYGEIRFSQISLLLETPNLPMSIISPDLYDPGTIGRRFPWGFADPYKADHCDFVRLKESLFNEWRDNLRQASREKWYEGWRTSRLRRTNTTVPPFPHDGLGVASRMVSNASSKPGHGLGLSTAGEVQQRAVSSGKDSAVSGSEFLRSSEEQKVAGAGIAV